MPPKIANKDAEISAQAAANAAAANSAANKAAANANAISAEMDRRMQEFQEQDKAYLEIEKKKTENREESFLAIIKDQQKLLAELKSKSNVPATATQAATAPLQPLLEENAAYEAGPAGSGLTAELNPLGHYLGSPSRGCSNGDIGKSIKMLILNYSKKNKWKKYALHFPKVTLCLEGILANLKPEVVLFRETCTPYKKVRYDSKKNT